MPLMKPAGGKRLRARCCFERGTVPARQRDRPFSRTGGRTGRRAVFISKTAIFLLIFISRYPAEGRELLLI